MECIPIHFFQLEPTMWDKIKSATYLHMWWGNYKAEIEENLGIFGYIWREFKRIHKTSNHFQKTCSVREASDKKTDNIKRERVVKHLKRMRSLSSSIVIVDSISDPIFPWIDFCTMRKNTKTSRQFGGWIAPTTIHYFSTLNPVLLICYFFLLRTTSSDHPIHLAILL